MVDVLASGGQGAPWDAGRLLRWRPPGAVVAVVAAAVLATGLAGAAAVGPVRAAAERVALAVDARSVVTVRTRHRDGVLLLGLRNSGRRDVAVRSAELRVAGARAEQAARSVVLAPGERTELALPFSVRSCRDLAARGAVRLTAAVSGGPEQVLTVPVDEGTSVPADLVAAGCRPVTAPGAVVLAVRGLGGERRVAGPGVRGAVLLEVRNQGGDLELVEVHAEVPGTLVSTAAVRPLPAAASAVVRLPFSVPTCQVLRRTGRVVLTVRTPGAGTDELGFRVTEDEEARTVRDVDLDVVLRSCTGGVPLP